MVIGKSKVIKPFFIGIAGGSGSGKTALAKTLKKHFGRKSVILHLDNYQKFEGKLPILHGMKNWDSPESINWNKLYKDLLSLKKRKPVILTSREQKYLRDKKKIIFHPSDIVIIEGYLLFYRKFIRQLIDFRVFLRANQNTRLRRRTKDKSRPYVEKILLPMHKKYIQPARNYADLVLNTEKHSTEECCKKIVKCLPF